MDKKILNLGCGIDTYGTHRIDFNKAENTTEVCNLEIDKLPYPDNYFDEIYSKSVLEHIRNLRFMLDECKRVLKKGGTFWFRTDNASYIPFHFRSHQDWINYPFACKEDKHYFLFKAEHLENLFRDFSDLKISYTVPNKKIFFMTKKFKCIHIEITGVK